MKSLQKRAQNQTRTLSKSNSSKRVFCKSSKAVSSGRMKFGWQCYQEIDPQKKKVSESRPWKDTGSQPFLSDAAIIRLFQWPCEDLGPICYQINEKWFCGRSMPAMTCHKSQSPNRSTPHGQRLIKIPPPNGNPRRLKENVKTRPGSRTLTQQTDAWNYKLVEVGWPSGTRSGGSGIECLHCTGPIVEY